REIVRQTLAEYRKRLEERPGNDQMAALLAKEQSDNPLYLIAACEELRVFGAFERVTERIDGLPSDMAGLFGEVLGRLEHDPSRGLVEAALSVLACARYGLLETELLALLGHDGAPLPWAVWAPLYRGLRFYLRPPGEAGEGMLGFFHGQLAQAVRQR